MPPVFCQGAVTGMLPWRDAITSSSVTHCARCHLLQEVTSRKDQAQYWVQEEPWQYINAQELAGLFAKSKRGQANAAQLEGDPPRTAEGRRCCRRRTLSH